MRLGLSLALNRRRGSGEPPTPAAPANTVAPSITGTPTDGETLTAVRGTWTGYPSITYTYQWKADTVNISGATASTYVLTTDEVGADITVTVTGTNTEGSDTATSAAVGPVAVATGTTAFLLESGDYLLLESGDLLLLESA